MNAESVLMWAAAVILAAVAITAVWMAAVLIINNLPNYGVSWFQRTHNRMARELRDLRGENERLRAERGDQ